MKLLLETCAVSEIRLSNSDGAIKTFLEEFDNSATFLSVTTLGEIARGIKRSQAGSENLNYQRG